MASREGFQEVVFLFDAAGSKIDLEMRLGQFNGLLAQKGTLGSHAASTPKAAYAQVGAGLAVRAVVFYLFKVNEQGYVDPAFNLPLEYMAQNAGEGPDLGNGIISMACRSQCPVPWHAINMWEPAGEGKKHPAMLVQKAVWRNRLGLKAVPSTRRSGDVSSLSDGAPARLPHIETDYLPFEQAANGSSNGASHGATGASPGLARMQAMEDKLTAAFGAAGRVSTTRMPSHSRQSVSRAAEFLGESVESAGGTRESGGRTAESIGRMAEQFRAEMTRQQQGYLDQIKSCREEIQQLKATLRHEQQRNRRLQQLLRGDV